MKSMKERRLDQLEANIRRMRLVRSDPFADGVLEWLTDTELLELGNLFQRHGVDEFEDLPKDAQAHRIELISTARQRSQPAPWPASNAPGYDVMASVRETYEASKARLAQTDLKSASLPA